MKRAVVSVTNDLVTDQRVHKVCLTLTEMGFHVLLTGRKLPESPEMNPRPYAWKRMRLFFRKGPLFYASYNIRLFFFLLFHKAGLLVSNDLDTLPANFLVAKIKEIPLHYDAHEYFTEVPDLQGRIARKVWLVFERYIFPKLKDVTTVSRSIAHAYEKKYGVPVKIVRNLPIREMPEVVPVHNAELSVPSYYKLVILQGSGINRDRGGEEAVLAMKYVEHAVLLVVGGGDVLPDLKRMAERKNLRDRVKFIPRQDRNKLYAYTTAASIGLSLDKDTALNYRYSLPNKIFDYIRCGVPVLASNLPEVAAVVREYDVGLVLEDYSVEAIADAINKMLSEDYKNLKAENLRKASDQLTWDTEVEILKEIYRRYV